MVRHIHLRRGGGGGGGGGEHRGHPGGGEGAAEKGGGEGGDGGHQGQEDRGDEEELEVVGQVPGPPCAHAALLDTVGEVASSTWKKLLMLSRLRHQ